MPNRLLLLRMLPALFSYGRVVERPAAVGTASCAGAGMKVESLLHPAPAKQFVHFLAPSSINAPQPAQCPFLHVLQM